MSRTTQVKQNSESTPIYISTIKACHLTKWGEFDNEFGKEAIPAPDVIKLLNLRDGEEVR